MIGERLLRHIVGTYPPSLTFCSGGLPPPSGDGDGQQTNVDPIAQTQSSPPAQNLKDWAAFGGGSPTDAPRQWGLCETSSRLLDVRTTLNFYPLGNKRVATQPIDNGEAMPK